MPAAVRPEAFLPSRVRAPRGACAAEPAGRRDARSVGRAGARRAGEALARNAVTMGRRLRYTTRATLSWPVLLGCTPSGASVGVSETKGVCRSITPATL